MFGNLKFEKHLWEEIGGEIVAHFPPKIEKSDENRLPYAEMNELYKELEIPMAEIAEIAIPFGETTKVPDIPFDAM